MNYPFKDFHLYETAYLNPSLPVEKFHEIYLYLERQKQFGAASELYAINWSDPGEWGVWKVEDKDAEFKGTWGKRFSNMVYRRRNHKIPSEILNHVSNMVQSTLRVHDSKMYCYQFVSHADWTPGAFGESDTSCWWDDYNNARISLIKEGGRAMLIYPTREAALRYPLQGMGRCWLFPTYDNKGIVMFNGYGVSLQTMAHVVSTQLGWHMRRVDIEEVEGAYINGDTGFVLTATPYTSNYVSMDEFVKWKTCRDCRNVISISEYARCSSCYTKKSALVPNT